MDRSMTQFEFGILCVLSDRNYTFSELTYTDKVTELLGLSTNLMDHKTSVDDKINGTCKIMKTLSQLVSSQKIVPQQRFHDEGQIEFEVTTGGEEWIDMVNRMMNEQG